MKGKAKKIIEVKERVLGIDEVIEKVYNDKLLTRLELNDLKSHTVKLQRRGTDEYDKLAKVYVKARKKMEIEGYAEKTWIGVHLDGSFIESDNKEKLVDLMYGTVQGDEKDEEC